MSVLHRELCEIVSALESYDHQIIESPFLLYLYCDHNPIPIYGDAEEKYHIGSLDMK